MTFAVWLATVQSVSASEAPVGGFCALCCALPAPWLRRANDGAWTPQPGWILWLPMMLRPEENSLVLHRFPDASDQPESAVRR